MSETIATAQLRAFIERIERVEAEIKELNADKSEIYKELRGVGFDVKAVRQCVAARKMDSSDLAERNAIFDTYWAALTGASHVHVHEDSQDLPPHDRDTGEIIEPNSAIPGTKGHASGIDTPSSAENEAEEISAPIPHSLPAPSQAADKAGEVAPPASPAPIPEPFEPPQFLVKAAKPLRPLCLNPSECAGYGAHTCHRCLTAAGQKDEAA